MAGWPDWKRASLGSVSPGETHATPAQYRSTSALNSNSFDTIHKQLIDHLSHLSESEVRDIAQQAGIITPTGQLSKHYG